METPVFIVAVVVALIFGILIGFLSRQPKVSTLELEAAQNLIDANAHQRTSQARKEQIATLQKALTRAHDRSGCKNGDEWHDHTEEHPEGLTRKRVAKMEAEQKSWREKRVTGSSRISPSRILSGISPIMVSNGIMDAVSTYAATSPSVSCDTSPASAPSSCE